MKYFIRILAFGFILAFIMGFTVQVFNLNSPKVAAQSNSFQAGHIIDDNIFTNKNALNEAGIQQFLNDMMSGVGGCYSPGTHSGNSPNGSCINQFCENTSTLANNFSGGSCVNGEISAAQIIYNAAQQYNINPEVILTTLQKEQGLVTDNWPWYVEYQHAMGYACPDSSGCSSSYADFYKQIDGATWQFRDYLNNPGAFNYWIGNNSINYAPGCAGSNVDIQNAATAVLYIYTPYQPDSNVLNNTNSVGSNSGPGPTINDNCATYGNRNFWWYFNTWFGPSVDTNVSLAEESGTYTYYVIYDGQKQAIPSQDVLNAWGLNGLPVTNMDPSVFNSIPTASTSLSRYAFDTSNNTTYFADNGNVYTATPTDSLEWNLPSLSEANVQNDLINFANEQGGLKPFVSQIGSSTIYAVDNGGLDGFTNSTAYNIWAGDGYSPLNISSSYISQMASGTTITSPELNYRSNNYVVSNGSVIPVSNSISQLLPGSWSPATIGSGLFEKFILSGNLNYMAKGSGATVYLLDGGSKKGIPNSEIYDAFQTSSGSNISQLSDDLINDIPTSSTISGNVVNDNGEYFSVYNGLHIISGNIINDYGVNGSNTVSLSSNFTTVLPSSSPATQFVFEPGSSQIYYLEGGQKYPFANPLTYSLAGGNGSNNTSLTYAPITQIPTSSIMSDYVTSGGGNYFLNGTGIYTVPSSAIATDWGLTNPIGVNSSTISQYSSEGNLTQNIQIPDGHYCLVDSGNYYCANSSNVLSNWQLYNSYVKPSQPMISELLTQGAPLSNFVSGKQGQQYGFTVFTVNNGQLYPIATLPDANNLGYGSNSTSLDQSTISNLISSNIWQGYLAQDNSGNIWILEGQYKFLVPTNLVSSWVYSQSPTLLTDNYLSSFINAGTVTNSIRDGEPTVYGVVNGMLEPFSSSQQYSSSGLEPFSYVSNSLVNSMPSGPAW